jgi:hypothetical protein
MMRFSMLRNDPAEMARHYARRKAGVKIETACRHRRLVVFVRRTRRPSMAMMKVAGEISSIPSHIGE